MATTSKPTVYEFSIIRKPSGGVTVYVHELSDAGLYGHPLWLDEEQEAAGATPLFPSVELAHEAAMAWRAAQLAKVGHTITTPTTGKKADNERA